MKTLVIAEKPSVGRDIARVLECGKKGDGCLIGEEYIISWAIGHLVMLQEPEDYDAAHKRWNMSQLPIMPQKMGLKAVQKTKKQLNILKKLMNASDTASIVCATDSGREGELIFRYIYEWAGCKKPAKRLWISSLTDAAIAEGLAKMKDISEYNNLYASARCRAESDWLVGMNATRAFTIAKNELLHMGRVQTPTLAMLVARHHEIAAFTPHDYYEVKATFTLENAKKYHGMWINPDNKENDERTYDKEIAQAVAEKVKNKPATITSVKTEEKRQPAPQLFDLTELQRECNRKLGFSAKKTLELAQSLYEKHKMITYPRTDSRYLTSDIAPKLPKTVAALDQPEYKPFSDYLTALPTLPTTPRIINDAKVTDHHAIIPTGSKKTLTALTADERAVYDRIARNFLAAFHPPYIYDITTVITQVENENFRSKGKIEKQAGWTAIYSHENKKSQDPETLPTLKQNDTPTTTNAEVLSKKTQPPKPYTEATLLSAMENAGRMVDDETLKEALKQGGLGTPATRAAIIEKLLSGNYAAREKKALHPTEKGIRLISLAPPEMKQPETTGKWERALSRIAQGEMDENRFMESIRRYVTYLVDFARKGD